MSADCLTSVSRLFDQGQTFAGMILRIGFLGGEDRSCRDLRQRADFAEIAVKMLVLQLFAL